MESPQVCKIFIWYLHLGPPGCKVTTLPPARLLQGREAQERHSWALCWLHRVLSSFEGRLPVAGPCCKVPAGQPCGLPRAGALIWAWLPTLDIHSYSGYFCNRIPPTVDWQYELSDQSSGCGSKTRWAGGVMQYIFTLHELYPEKKRRQNVQNPCLAFYMVVSMWEPSIFHLQYMEKKLCK